jgi:hypothetical protein
MKIKNYTSSVQVVNTVARIEQKIAAAGANGIIKEYGMKGEVSAITFTVKIGEQQFAIRLPAKVEECFKHLMKEYNLSRSRPRLGAEDRIREQAERTAWKIVQEWTEIQISMIVMKQAEFLEVFMPYIWNGKTRMTMFETMKQSGFKQLDYQK